MEILMVVVGAISAIAPLVFAFLTWKSSQRRKAKIILQGWFDSLKRWCEYGIYLISGLFATTYLYVYVQSEEPPTRIQNVLMVECIFLLFEFGIIAAYVYCTKKYGNKREQQDARIEKLEKQIQLLSESSNRSKKLELEPA